MTAEELQVRDFDKEIIYSYSRSSGPGGQNVNKRETAVRVTHIPTGITAVADGERSQAQNREQALQLVYGKLFAKMDSDRKKAEQWMYISKTTQIEWGNQIRSYVEHPYKMVKDHRTDTEVRDVDAVLGGDIQLFLDSEKDL
jgi:peptide chain release factor 2